MVRLFHLVFILGFFIHSGSFTKVHQTEVVAGSDSTKRDGSPSPNDLFWANRGKKSSPARMPKPHSMIWPIAAVKRGGNFGSIRPNSFMNMYLANQDKRSSMLNNMRPNNFLFPSMMTDKRNGLINTRPNSYLFPYIKSNSKRNEEDGGTVKNLRPNSFIFPIPKRDQGQFSRSSLGKRSYLEESQLVQPEEDEEMLYNILKRSEFGANDINFFAGRGKKNAIEGDMQLANFFAGRGKKSETDLNGDLTFFAGRGKRDTLKMTDDVDNAFWAVRG